MKINAALRKRIVTELPRLQTIMGLAHWEVKTKFHDEQPPEDEDVTFEEQQSMSVECFPKYLKVILNVYPKFALRVAEKPVNFELFLLHELGHVILSPYDKLLDEYLSNNDAYHHEFLSEQATEMIARAVGRAMGLNL